MTTSSNIFGDLPATLRDELVHCYNEILRNFMEEHWEPSELNGGKLCEVVYSILKGYVDGNYPSAAYKPSNMVDACRSLEQAPANFPRSVRIQIPRMLIALYEIRNNRGVGHVGGDVNPNQMDSTVVLGMSKWIMAELVRIFHRLDHDAAELQVEALTERTYPLVWVVGDIHRILNPGLSIRDQVLALLYQTGKPTPVGDLLRWTEYSNPSRFRNKILEKAHKERLIEFDKEKQLVFLSPTGTHLVESDILSQIE